MSSVGILYTPRYLEHETGPGHAESPQRLTAVWDHLQETGFLTRLKRLIPVAHKESWIETIHTHQYIQRVRKSCENSARFLDTPDTGIGPKSFEIACLAVDGALTLVDAVMQGKIASGFGLLRPPGHHAEPGLALGFCLFNNVAIAARYAQKQHGLKRVAILDWDVHHGNGTQHAFEEDSTVFYASTHQWPLYPGTGLREEQGDGNILNVPLLPGAGDEEIVRAFQEEIIPALDRFQPELVLISAGFDAHRNDPLAYLQVTEDGYRRMTELVLKAAERHSAGRIVSVLEGGYHLPSLARSVKAHLEALGG